MSNEILRCKLCGRRIHLKIGHWVGYKCDSIAYCDASKKPSGWRYHELEEKEDNFDKLYLKLKTA